MANNLVRYGAVTIFPAQPGVPYRPAYTVTERLTYEDVTLADDAIWLFGWALGPGIEAISYANAGGEVAVPVSTRSGGPVVVPVTKTVILRRTIPAQEAIPAVPERRVVSPPEGWNGYGRSVQPLYEGTASFRISPNAKGIAIGLAQLSLPTVGYNHIPQGFLFTGGQARNLQTNLSYGAYAGSDVFRLKREGSTLTLLRGASVLASETMSYGADQPLYLTATIFGVQDAVIDPVLSPAARRGTSTASLPALAALSTDGVYAGSLAVLPDLTAASGLLNKSVVGLPAVTALSSNKPYAGSLVALPELVASSYSGAWTVEPNNESFALLSPLLAASIMLNGELGQSEAVFGGMSGMSADRAYGGSAAELSGISARSWVWPNGNFASFLAGVGLKVDITARTLTNVQIPFTLGLDIDLTVDETAQERLDFTLGLDVPMTFSTVDTVEMLPIFAFDFNVDVPGAFRDTWVMNLRTGASSRYENFYFDSFMNVDGVLYGANSEGLFELGGDDDDGAPIEAVIDFGLKSFGSNQLKRLEQIYLTVASDGPMFVRVTAEGASYTYTMRDFNEAMQTQRVTPGKGMRANYFGFEVGNIDGADCELSAVEVLVAESARRI